MSNVTGNDSKRRRKTSRVSAARKAWRSRRAKQTGNGGDVRPNDGEQSSITSGDRLNEIGDSVNQDGERIVESSDERDKSENSGSGINVRSRGRGRGSRGSRKDNPAPDRATQGRGTTKEEEIGSTEIPLRVTRGRKRA